MASTLEGPCQPQLAGFNANTGDRILGQIGNAPFVIGWSNVAHRPRLDNCLAGEI